jgi:anti-sigma-K factor RskA
MRPDLHTLSGAYALDALPGEERPEFEAHLGACDACHREVIELQATACRLAPLAAEAPPARFRARVLAEIDLVRQESPSEREAGSSPRRRPRLAAVLAAPAAAAALAVGTPVLITGLPEGAGESETASSRAIEVLAAPDADTITVDGPDGAFARVVVSGVRGEAVFLADGMEPAPHRHTYELWLIEGDHSTPAGLFDVDESGRATRVLTGDLDRAAAIGVTVEPEGGSPRPTTDPVMLIELEGS